MKNQTISDFVAAKMDEVLNSKEHKALFANQYKMASAPCKKCGEECCKCDSSMASDALFADDENDARKKKKEESSSDSSSADDADDDSCMADDDENDARKKKKEDDSSSDSSSADDMEVSAAFDVAIDSLLTASAALDSV